jgi:hypothetical protein
MYWFSPYTAQVACAGAVRASLDPSARGLLVLGRGVQLRVPGPMRIIECPPRWLPHAQALNALTVDLSHGGWRGAWG